VPKPNILVFHLFEAGFSPKSSKSSNHTLSVSFLLIICRKIINKQNIFFLIDSFSLQYLQNSFNTKQLPQINFFLHLQSPKTKKKKTIKATNNETSYSSIYN